MKSIIFLLIILSSFSVFAETSEEAKQRIEIEKEAICSFVASTNQYCFNGTCRRWKNYSCSPDEAALPDFKVRMRITTRSVRYLDEVSGEYRDEQVGEERVTSTTFLE